MIGRICQTGVFLAGSYSEGGTDDKHGESTEKDDVTGCCRFYLSVLVLQPFYSSLDCVWDYPGQPVPER